MKILQAVSLLSPRRGGGVATTVYEVSKALVQRGHDVTIFTSDFELDRGHVNSLAGVEVHAFHSYLKLGKRPLLIPGAIKQARETLKDFDIIHTHECRSFLNLVLHHYARKYRVPYIVDSHGAARKSKGRLKSLLDILYGRRILRNAARVIAETELGISEYRAANVGEDKVAIIYPPFTVEGFDELPPPGSFSKKFNIEGKRIITFMGRINQIKGLDFLLQSFCELNRLRDDLILAIIGPDDGYQASLESMVDRLNLADKVLFTGYLSGDEKMSALAEAAVMVLPSSYEQGLPKPCIEAILCGTAAIITGNTGAAVIAGPMDAVYQIEYGNDKELINAVQDILDNPADIAGKVQQTRQYILANLSMEAGIEKYEKLYTACIREMA